jgi:hypothetical protein
MDRTVMDSKRRKDLLETLLHILAQRQAMLTVISLYFLTPLQGIAGLYH